MIVKDKNNREVEITVSGRDHDDIEISDAIFVDNPDEEVPDEVVDYIWDTYADDLYQEWYENMVCEAEYYYDSLMDR